MKLRKYVSAPRRLLRKARELYVESMVNLDDKVGRVSNIGSFPPLAPPPHNFGENYWMINHSTSKEVALLRTTTERIVTTTKEEFDMSKLDGVQRCYSTLGLGRVATIEEDKWYDYDEEINTRIDLHISKSRSHAIGRRSIGGYY